MFFGKTMSVYNTTGNLKVQFFKSVIHLRGSVWTEDYEITCNCKQMTVIIKFPLTQIFMPYKFSLLCSPELFVKMR